MARDMKCEGCAEMVYGNAAYCEKHLECIECGSTAKDVTPRSFGRGRAFPRCDRCAARREKAEAHIRELESPCPAPWFDEADAGERWDSDDA